MEINCPECNASFDIDEHPEACPECGFGPDECDHPVSYRESEWVYDHGEEQELERVYCGKCGTSVQDM